MVASDWLWGSTCYLHKVGKIKLWAISVLGWRLLKCKYEKEGGGSNYCGRLTSDQIIISINPVCKCRRGWSLSPFSLSLASLGGKSGKVGGTCTCFWLAAFTSSEKRRKRKQQVGSQEHFHELETGWYFYYNQPQEVAFYFSLLLCILLVNAKNVHHSLCPQRSPSARAGGCSFQPHTLRNQ